MTAFDDLATDYDRTFTDTMLGRRLRERVWQRLDAVVGPGARVLELNCGTGEDAVHLASRGARVLATDVAARMVEVTRRKADAAGVGRLVETRVMAIEDVGDLDDDASFDVVVSNFGGLNCVADLRAVAAALAPIVRPGGSAMLCVMGPVAPWEWAWCVVRRRPRDAVRRLRRGGVEWRGLRIRYPSIRTTRRAFSPAFAARRVAPIGIALPPSDAGEWLARHPRLFAALDRAEGVLARVPGSAWLGDHYLLELVRR